MSALQELLEKVEAGTAEEPDFCKLWHESGLCVEANNADGGSLDAAKALHEAVLPGWEWEISAGDAIVFRFNEETDESENFLWINKNPARAWLIAILKALIAEQQETE